MGLGSGSSPAAGVPGVSTSLPAPGDVVFTWALTALSGSLMLAVPVAMVAGVVSFFSPCVVPLLPGYLSYATGLSGADLGELGIPTEDELVAEYCRHAGREPIDNWPFYVIYNMFRSASIIQGVYKRGLNGNASSEKALEYKDAARIRSEQAWALVESL